MDASAEIRKQRQTEYFRQWRMRRMTAEQRAAYDLRKVARVQSRIEREENKRIAHARAQAARVQRELFACAREEAIAAGVNTYIGHPCGQCGGTVRYVGNNGAKCKACNDAQTSTWQRANRELMNARARERNQRRRLAAQMKTPEPLRAAGRLESTKDRTDEREQCTQFDH
jgi:hypothetical protein